MSRIPRPRIPDAIKVQVAERQLRAFNCSPGMLERSETRIRDYLGRLLRGLALYMGDAALKLELHHRPALINRCRYEHRRKTFYDPPANDPNHLVYLPEADHDVETRVRGLLGQHSDLGLWRKNKNIARNRDPKRRKVKIPQRQKNAWPTGRKIRN